MAKYWYSFMGSTIGDRYLTLKYNYVGINYPVSNPCAGVNQPCLIYATGPLGTQTSTTHPSPGATSGQLSANLQSYIQASMGFQRLDVSTKAYIYNKD